MIKYHKLGQECMESQIGLLVERADGIDDLDRSVCSLS